LKIEKIVFTDISSEELPKVLDSLTARPKNALFTDLLVTGLIAGVMPELFKATKKPAPATDKTKPEKK